MEVPEICCVNTAICKEINFSLCIICQKASKECFVKQPNLNSIKKLLDCLKTYSESGVKKYMSVHDSLCDENAQTLQEKGCVYHRQCYSSATNVTYLRRLSRGDSTSNQQETVEKRTTRSSLDNYDNSMCFFCQKDIGHNLYNLRTINRSTMIKNAIEKQGNEVLRIRFNSAIDAHAGDMKYHTSCMVSNVDNVLSQSRGQIKVDSDGNDAIRMSVEEDILTTIEHGINSGSIYQMTDIYKAYMKGIQQNGGRDDRHEKTIRLHLKMLLERELDGVVIEAPSARNQSAKIYCKTYMNTIVEAAVEKTLEQHTADMNTVSKACSIIRVAVLKHITLSEKSVDLEMKTDIPIELLNAIIWIIGGFKSLDGKRNDDICKAAEILSNTILYNVKTDRQANYKPKNKDVALFRGQYENPQVVNLGLTVRQFGRRKGLLNMFHDFGYTVSNWRCISIETSLANDIIKKTIDNGFYLPPNIGYSNIIQFHLDNSDFQEDGDDGKNTTHALLLVGAQYTKETPRPMKIISKENSKKLLPNTFGDLLECRKPQDKEFRCSESWKDFNCHENAISLKEKTNCTRAWLMAKSLELTAFKFNEAVSDMVVCVKDDDKIPIIDLMDTEEEFLEDINISQVFQDQAINIDPIDTDDESPPQNMNISPCKQVESEDEVMPLHILQSTTSDLFCETCSAGDKLYKQLCHYEEKRKGGNNGGLISIRNLSQPKSNVVNEMMKLEDMPREIISICDEKHSLINRCFTQDLVSFAKSASELVSNLRLPSYSAYNSVLTASGDKHKTLANILMFPLIPGPSNDYNAIYTAFKLAQNVTTHICGASRKTIITLDLDLYERALRLRNSRPDLINQYIFRLGVLHIVFAEVRAIGRYIENTGIDDAWIRSTLIGPCTVKQVLTCSHMKRSLIIHEATLLAMYGCYIKSVIKEFPGVFFSGNDSLLQCTLNLNQAFAHNNLQDIPRLHRELDERLHDDGFIKSLKLFNEERERNFQFKMIKVYINMVERLLLFVHASRTRNWHLHLSSTEELIQDITSMDRIKYRRMLPVYLAEMRALRKDDPEVWAAFEQGEFSVQKNPIPFTAIGMDHTGEQVNKILKVEGGIVGISRNENARTRFMITAPIIAQIATDTKESSRSSGQKTLRHHQLNDAYCRRQNEMVDRIGEVLHGSNLNFDAEEDKNMRNFVTNGVFPITVQNNILAVEEIGKKEYESLVKDRLEGKTNIWTPIKRLNLRLATDSNKKKTLKVDHKLVDVKAHRELFSRCAIVASSSRDIDMKTIIGDYELDVVPRSLMTSDGNLHPGHEGKHKLAEELTDSYSAEFIKEKYVDGGSRVVIIDAMVLVQKIASANKDNRRNVKTCEDFAELFLNSVRPFTEEYEEVRVVFDVYKDLSLKDATRDNRGKTQCNRRFLITDNTVINMTLKLFLSDVTTKQDLTIYFAEKCDAYLQKCGIRYLVSANHSTFGNIPCDSNNNHEEADTLLIWHAIQATTTLSEKDRITIYSPDTDVLCLLIAFKEKMTKHVYLQTTFHLIDIDALYCKLGSLKSKALLCLHALSGCDTTGRFINKGKPSWYKTFLSCDEVMLRAVLSIQGEDPSQQIGLLETLICKLYCPKAAQIRCLNDARWYLFKKLSAQCERLPPTSGSFKQAVLRASCQAKIWAQSDKSICAIPDPLLFGWELIDNRYIPISSENDIAPASILHLLKCGCEKENCQSGKCKCYKSGLVCTDLCTCSNHCENMDAAKFEKEGNVVDDELFDDMTL